MGNQTANKVAQAFIEGKRKTLGNYQSTGYSFLLFGHVLAEKCEEGFHIKDCGYCTPTTAIALNALPGVRLRRLKESGYVMRSLSGMENQC